MLFRCKFTIRGEVDAKVVYVDPVHDYAYLKFDPGADTVQDMDIHELEMRPDLARVEGTVFVRISTCHAWASPEEAILVWCEKNQATLRAYLYCGLADAIRANDGLENSAQFGRRHYTAIVIPGFSPLYVTGIPGFPCISPSIQPA